MRLSSKLLTAPESRLDGIIQHELGHVVDLTSPKGKLNQWARRHGVQLPATDERRADAIAEAIWRRPIYYDNELVQSTEPGTAPRPTHLGL